MGGYIYLTAFGILQIAISEFFIIFENFLEIKSRSSKEDIYATELVLHVESTKIHICKQAIVGAAWNVSQ